MGNTVVDQIAPDGTLVHDVDTTISQKRRHDLILDALPGATLERIAGVTVVLYDDQVILSKQVTYLGNPWEVYKKRIQIPPGVGGDLRRRATYEGLTPRFVGVYHYDGHHDLRRLRPDDVRRAWAQQLLRARRDERPVPGPDARPVLA